MAKIVIDSNRCKACKLCIAVCPQKIITLSNDLNASGDRYAVQIHSENCTGCKFCGIMCPDNAIEVYK